MKNGKLLLIASTLAPALALAEDVTAATTATGPSSTAAWAAGIGMAFAAAVIGFSQSRAAAAALEGIGRNPGAAQPMTVPLVLSLALMESLCLLAFVIAGKLSGLF